MGPFVPTHDEASDQTAQLLTSFKGSAQQGQLQLQAGKVLSPRAGPFHSEID